MDFANEYDAPVEETAEIPIQGTSLDSSFLLLPVSDLMRTKIATATANDTIARAAERMTQRGTGCVLVVEGSTLIGILSERDVLNKVVATGENPLTARVGEHMTAAPETLAPDDEIAYALNLMAIGGFRHVPIVRDDNTVLGIVSIRDVQRHVTEHFEKVILNLPPRPLGTGPARRHGG